MTLRCKYTDKKACIIGNHPHKNTLVLCEGVTWVDNQWVLVFKNTTTNQEFFVFDHKNVQWINSNDTNNATNSRPE